MAVAEVSNPFTVKLKRQRPGVGISDVFTKGSIGRILVFLSLLAIGFRIHLRPPELCCYLI
jgi:hypothetical protein